MNDVSKTLETRAYYDALAERLKNGAKHSSLGPNLGDKKDWWAAGQKKFEKVVRTFAIRPKHRVVEYGCGSLRVGAHFIRYLDRGCFAGLDVSAAIVDLGKELVGEPLLREKMPKLGAISAETLAEITAFNTDFVYSSAVAYAVQPQENDEYLSNLARLTHRKGAVLFFDTKLSDPPFPYGGRCWARPFSLYAKGLQPLKFVRFHFEQKVKDTHAASGATSAILEFRRE